MESSEIRQITPEEHEVYRSLARKIVDMFNENKEDTQTALRALELLVAFSITKLQAESSLDAMELVKISEINIRQFLSWMIATRDN